MQWLQPGGSAQAEEWEALALPGRAGKHISLPDHEVGALRMTLISEWF